MIAPSAALATSVNRSRRLPPEATMSRFIWPLLNRSLETLASRIVLERPASLRLTLWSRSKTGVSRMLTMRSPERASCGGLLRVDEADGDREDQVTLDVLEDVRVDQEKFFDLLDRDSRFLEFLADEQPFAAGFRREGVRCIRSEAC